MKKINRESIRNIKWICGIAAVLFCTIVGGYGILTAPKSDQKELEQSLKQNQKALEEEALEEEIQETLKGKRKSSLKANTSPDTAEPAGKILGGKSADAPASEKHLAEKNSERERISVIGDSVFLGAAPSFKKLFPQAAIDAKVSRQVRHGLEIAKKLEKKGKLADVVIISLGTNGTFNSATGQELIDYLGAERTIYWIDAYGQKLDIQKEVNRTIHQLVKKNANVHLIPWSQEGKKHPGWFYQDGTHLNLKGQRGFTRYLQKSLTNSNDS